MVAVTCRANWRRAMKRIIIASMLLLSSAVYASAADTWVFRDTLRPGGHERSMAAKRADGRKCGSSRQNTFSDSSNFAQCMQTRGWALDHVIPDQTSRYIDPDTGMSCRNVGGAAICDPPQGTVKYFDPEQGLNCTRTGIVSVCSNL
jgi:hypothetical protein